MHIHCWNGTYGRLGEHRLLADREITSATMAFPAEIYMERVRVYDKDSSISSNVN
jgi:hypothetical protein